MKIKFVKLSKLIICLMMYCTFVNAGGVKIKSGSLSLLSAEKTIHVKFDYSELKVRSEKMDMEPEADYVTRMTNGYNEKKAGKGDIWKQDWTANRTLKFQPAFIKQFNKEAGKIISVIDSGDSKYTLVVKAQLINPGFNNEIKTGVYDPTGNHYASGNIQRAYILFAYSVIETSNNSSTVCEMEPILAIEKSEDVARDIGSRITDVFEFGGKELGKCFVKNLK